MRRIGVAVGCAGPDTASPLATVAARDGHPDWVAIDRLVGEWQPDCLVAGIPYNRGRPDGGIIGKARQFAEMLGERYGLGVDLVDEELTSHEASDRLRGVRRSGIRRSRVRTGDIDAMAACVIAEAWLETQRSAAAGRQDAGHHG